MNTVKRFVISLLAVAVMFGLAGAPVASTAGAAGACPAPAVAAGKKVKDAKVKKGPEVAARVRALRESSENVRAALRYFERKGRPSKVEESFAFYGSYGSGKQVASLGGRFGAFLMPAAFAPQDQSSISDGSVEIIFVPNYSVGNEWQGSIIANRYDEYGNLVEQYVAESVLTTPDPNYYTWDEIYEAPVYGGEVQEPISEPGMYTDYEWGNTREQQPMDYQYVAGKNGADLRAGAKVVKAGYAAQTRRARVRAWARCSFAWCGGAAVACVGVNLWNAEILAGPCFAVGCVGSAIGCTWGTLWQ